MQIDPEIPSAVLPAFGLDGGKPAAIETGLINASWRIDTPAGERFVLQRVNPIFPIAVNADIDAVTRHLRDKAMHTPRIVPTLEEEPALALAGEVWRVLTFIPGITRDALENTRQAREAGAVLGRFHRAMSDFDHTFANPRLDVHDTPAHLAKLRQALRSHRYHPQFDRVAPLAERILALSTGLAELPLARKRIVHGDPKISNVVFDAQADEAICLIDLDTVGPMPVVLELGDAFRSWCNPLGEDVRETTFSVPLFRAALEGYAREARDLLSADEWLALPDAASTIALELAARFAADALHESYFGWDPNRFATASEHNQVRAAGQLRLAQQMRDQRGALHEAVVGDHGR